MIAHNATRAVTIAHRLGFATSDVDRRRGLAGRVGLNPGEGLWIIPCNAITTTPISFPIDVLFLDVNLNVVDMAKNVPPGVKHLVPVRATNSAIELEAGVIDATGTQLGDHIIAIH